MHFLLENMTNCLETILQHLWQPLKLETAFTETSVSFVGFAFCISGQDQALHGGSSGRMHCPIFVPAPGSLASPPQEKAGAQVPETGTHLST